MVKNNVWYQFILLKPNMLLQNIPFENLYRLENSLTSWEKKNLLALVHKIKIIRSVLSSQKFQKQNKNKTSWYIVSLDLQADCWQENSNKEDF